MSKKYTSLLLDRLLGILGKHTGESGESEGAVETLERIIRERDEGVVRGLRQAQSCFDSGPAGSEAKRVIQMEIDEELHEGGEDDEVWAKAVAEPPADAKRPTIRMTKARYAVILSTAKEDSDIAGTSVEFETVCGINEWIAAELMALGEEGTDGHS